MAKKTKMTPKQKQQHFFIIKGHRSSFLKNKIEVDFTPSKRHINLPIYNMDRRYTTPSFIVPSLHEGKKVDYQAEHRNKVLGTAEKSENNILVPRPRPKKNYCNVCCLEFDDYLTHIQSQPHKHELTHSQMHKQILQMCHKIQIQNHQKQQKQKQKQRQKQKQHEDMMAQLTSGVQEDSVSAGCLKMDPQERCCTENQVSGFGC